MNKKIKIIELLQDFADEKEIVMPQYVRYLDRNVNEKAIMLVCQENIIDKLDKKMIKLTDEVEILEDNTEEIEEIKEISDEYFNMLSDESKVKWLKSYIKEDRNKINELVKVVKEIRKDLNK